jgi:hypothetical protein
LWIVSTSLQSSLFDTTLPEYDPFDNGGFDLFEGDEFFRQPLRKFFADGPRNMRYLLNQLRLLERVYHIMFLEDLTIDWTTPFAISDWVSNPECREFCIADLATSQTDFSKRTVVIDTNAKPIHRRSSWSSASSNTSSHASESTICATDSIATKEESIHHASSWYSSGSNTSSYALKSTICAANSNVTKGEKSNYHSSWSPATASRPPSYTSEHITTITFSPSVVRSSRGCFLRRWVSHWSRRRANTETSPWC